MRRFFSIAFILILLLSCKKFVHTQLELPNCELCPFASTLSGEFRGYASGIAVPNYGDSMTIVLEQVFLGDSDYEDSTFMHFLVSYNFDSTTDSYQKTVRLENTSGVFENTIYAGSGVFAATPDSLRLHNTGSNGPSTSTYIGGVFYRQ